MEASLRRKNVRRFFVHFGHLRGVHNFDQLFVKRKLGQLMTYGGFIANQGYANTGCWAAATAPGTTALGQYRRPWRLQL